MLAMITGHLPAFLAISGGWGQEILISGGWGQEILISGGWGQEILKTVLGLFSHLAI
jgi:hypothetical protein